ncbi:1-hydroxycarotenoid 3,4-desaturase [Jannaschia faecimaris]|uniref:1-hydroxycarotenoid 3,4-desaturase n=1 Tax=Jannaschia faecimaris TaxID=1244108 RepID=A0A1H3TDK2_9RHOB|nr:1-hydroxycarotenoid 3,4-desaturase CrtD [Jannaschia faecimaris]SDZ48314.1 1-hydroxycarotenoid 3,4-desaturase [Jannaschia faecimaris]
MPETTDQSGVYVIGAGIGGLSAALRLAHAGLPITVLERQATPGGKMRCTPSDAGPVDAGPTVLTLRPVFEALFADVGESLSEHVTLHANPVLARHFWSDGTRLDLMADPAASRANIEAVFGTRARDDFDRFSNRARRLFEAFDLPMMQSAAPSQARLARRVLRNPALIADMAPHRSLMSLLDEAFQEPKLAQLFARYATYVGGLPHHAPALLSLIWQAEAQGVWSVKGGMHRLAQAIARLAQARGARILYGQTVTGLLMRDRRVSGIVTRTDRFATDQVVFNGDPRALQTGLLGQGVSRAVPAASVEPRSLSAHVHTFAARPQGPDLAAHNVFFADKPMAEFGPLARGLVPEDATLYICAQDRGGGASPNALERFEIIRNAPPTLSDNHDPTEETTQCHTRTFQRLARFGLRFSPAPQVTTLTTPTDFAALFPGSQGSLYGRSPAGLTAALKRPRARTAVPGLYLVGGGAHPGAGVPMATLSARHAAEAILADRTSTSLSHLAATPGGMSTA